MGERGPTPRRQAERRRRNEPTTPVTSLTREELDMLPFEVDYEPEPPDVHALDPDGDTWHPIVRGFWADMQRDPARKWMTSGDWGALAIFCESISRELNDQVAGKDEEGNPVVAKIPPKGATLTAFLKMLEHLGVSEQSRLRIGKEVSLFPPPGEPTETNGNVVPISTKRREGVQ